MWLLLVKNASRLLHPTMVKPIKLVIVREMRGLVG